jgi:hypothetical protein
MVDSLQRVDELRGLLQKCHDIVTKHISRIISKKMKYCRLIWILWRNFAKLRKRQEIIDLDDQFPVYFDDECDVTAVSAATVGNHHNQSRKGSCSTRLNLTPAMIESIADLQTSVNNTLKTVEDGKLCQTSTELELLKAMKNMLQEFERFIKLIG